MTQNHIMLDLETLGTGYAPAIVAIGACAFDPAGQGINPDTCYTVVDPDSAMEHGEAMGSTIKWWMQQSDAARAQTFTATALPLPDALDYFDEWVRQFGKDVAVWGNGATFDNVAIRSAYKSVGKEVPWSFRNDKCYRTMVNAVPEPQRPEFVREGTVHNALDDAVTQALHLQKVYMALGLGPAMTVKFRRWASPILFDQAASWRVVYG